MLQAPAGLPSPGPKSRLQPCHIEQNLVFSVCHNLRTNTGAEDTQFNKNFQKKHYLRNTENWCDWTKCNNNSAEIPNTVGAMPPCVI